ncbi:hypothetical protein PTSG_02461 [Salpingoeca rosetta]|uniref:MIR domain-containing protein n=1 Tax=Salpingoeca rosetta (strain ATCC 50818 / BSB-021) TaxID=946362 RepID=F2U297_SALR5|nr:uncharacterized protein PTSG_02461 [Salpingoeca rosetta]EGD81749.1 hypothetical protein PTSG_02461 [Salpingoeca rosetta]|eukprot:XP_004996953.1 hypothetical protein PTSG_02461 [Salpingoeca rosetta]
MSHVTFEDPPSGGNDDDDSLFDQAMCFGDHVSFYDAEHAGYVFCGISGSVHGSLMVKPSDRLNPDIGNFKTAVFQVRAQTKYKAQKNLRMALQRLRDDQNRPDLSLEDAMLSANEELLELHALAEAEKHDNQLEQERRKGDHVVYGQVVQLYHSFSHLYVRVSSTVTSAVEPSNMRIELDPAVSSYSWFRIMPRYKVRAEGERVRMGDQIVLESVKTGGQFMHTSAAILPEDKNIVPGCHDMSASVSPTALTVYPHMAHRDPEAKGVRGGDFIQLFHKEISAYLAAEGTYFENAPREDVHMRIREPDPRRPHRLKPPTSAVSFWQIEIDGRPTGGDLIEWESKIRLKHATTQKYLKLRTDSYLPSTEEPNDDDEDTSFGGFELSKSEATGGEMVLSLTDDANDPDAVFLMVAVIREKHNVENGAYARIQHCATGHWLHAAKTRPYERRWHFEMANDKLRTPLFEKLDRIEWDQAELKLATCTRNRMFDDAFIVQRVPFENVSYVNYVSGMVEVVRFFIRSRKTGELSSLTYRGFQQALREYTMFLSDNGKLNRMKQKLLRNFGVVELIVELLQVPFAEYNLAPKGIALADLLNPRDIKAETKRTLVCAYKLLAGFLTGESRKNELYVCRHIPFFLTQLGYDLDMETMYTALVEDNQKIVDVLEEPEIQQMVDLLHKDKDPRYLQFLSVLCSVDGVAIGENQERICKMLLECDHPPVYKTRLQDRRVFINIDGVNWTPLSDFAHTARKSPNRSVRRTYEFFVAQLDLFGELCLQRCSHAIRVITRDLGYLGWEECFMCARDDSLPPSLRKHYVELMINLFIDVDWNNDILEEVQLCFEWDKLSAKPFAEAGSDPSKSITGAQMPFFSALNEWILEFLQEHRSLEANMVEMNMFIASVLQLVRLLVSFGYYANPEDIERLMLQLKPMLSGFNDRPSRDPGERTHTVTRRKGLLRRETSAMDANDRKVVSEWRKKERYLCNNTNDAMVDVKIAALGVMDTLLNFSLSVRIEQFCFDFRQVVGWSGERRNTRQSRVGQVFHFKELTDGPTMHFDTMQCLTKMSKNDPNLDPYEQTDLVRSYVGELFDRANYLCPKWRPEASALRQGGEDDLVEILLDLAKYKYPRLTCKSLQLLDRLYKSAEHLFTYTIDAQLLLDPESIRLDARLKQDMPVLRRLGAGQIEVVEMDEFNDILKELTELCVVDRLNPHVINQRMIVNHGILNVLFDVLDQENQPKEVIISVLRCLEVLAQDYEYVQDEFFERLDKILTIETDATGWENALADAVMAVFADNQELSLALSVQQIELMMDILVKHNVRVPNMVNTLRSIVKCEELGVPLPRNQNIIMKNLMKHFAETVEVTFIDVEVGDENNVKRIELCEYSGKDEAKLREQRYHANMVGLIAQCAEGYTRFIESTCMTFFEIEEIIDVIANDKIPLFIKTEYMRFLNFVYLETTASQLEAGTQDLYSDMRLWHSLQHLASRHFDAFYTRQTAESPLLPEDEERFIYEAFLPLLTVVIRDFYQPKLCPTSQKPLADIATKIFSFADRALNNIFNHEHLKELSMAVLALKNAEGINAPSGLVNRIGKALRSHEADLVRTPAKQRYDARFSKQNEINELLNMYVEAVRKSYCGRNDLRVQLPHADYEPPEPKPYCENEDEDEPLPLGPDFQAFVNLFIEYEVDGRVWVAKRPRDDLTTLVESLKASRRYYATLETKDQEVQEKLDIRCLQALRCILHNQIKCEKEFESFQNDIASRGTVLPVADMLSVPSDDVVREALCLLIVLLEGGNKTAQDSFYEHFIGTREETFFQDVQARIRRSIESMRELRALKRSLEIESSKDNAMMGTITMINQLGDSGEGGMEMQTISSKACKDDDDLGIKDEGNIELVLRVLQYMCEGHNFQLQEYLRFQADNIHPINLVNVTVDFLATMMEDVSDDTIEVITQTLETLVEFSQGCPNNQQSIFDSKVVDSLNHLLRIPKFYEVCKAEKVARLHLACANLVLAMLENSDERTRSMAVELEQTLDIEHVFKMMHHYDEVHMSGADQEWETDEDEDDDPVPAQDVASAFFICIVRLNDFTHRNYQDDPKLNPPVFDKNGRRIPDTFAKLEGEVSSIEVLRDDQVHRVHFLNKWGDKIRPAVKEELKWNIERGSPAERFDDFLSRAKVIVADIQYFDRVMSASPVSHALLKHSALWSKIMLLLTFILNIFILSLWQAPRTWNTAVPDYAYDGYNTLLGIFGALHIFFSVLVATSYFALKPPSLAMSLPQYEFIQRFVPQPDENDYRTRSNIFDMSSFYHVLVVVFSVLGVFFHGYFYCFHLLHVVVGNDILLRVIKSVTKNGISLLWVAALMVIIIYIYSLVSFAFLRKNFDESEGAYCQTAFQCFITSLRLGLLSGGGLGEALPAATFGFAEPGLRTLFDLSFFILITTIGLNVVFGIIVDSFSELRDEKYQTQEIMQSECFICGLKAFDFERHGNGYDEHVHCEHNMWDYVAFFLHLEAKDRTEYTAHEQYVYEQFEKGEYAFFPVNHSLSLEGHHDNGVEERLTQVERTLQSVLARMEQDANERAAEAKRREIQESMSNLKRQSTLQRQQTASSDSADEAEDE